MCGLVGLINRSGISVSEAALRQMGSRIRHRGPDGDGIMLEANIGFYHRRLSIIDLQTGDQPMHFDGLSIVYNGELYNYIELREQLKSKGHVFRTSSDTEVVIHLYSEYGAECLDLMNGMFAFLILDRRTDRVFGARDHFGIKPLYYHLGKQTIAFGSEIKSLLAHPDIPADVDEESLEEYLNFQFVMGEKTMFRDIYKVEPGSYVVVNLNNFDFQAYKYWTPNFNIDKFHTKEYFLEALRHQLEETVAQQLRSDVPLGTYLSGGMDSSLVTMLCSKLTGGKLQSFSGAFHEGPEYNELKYARIVADAAGSELHEIFPTESDFIQVLPHLIYQLDEPVAGPGVFPQYMVSRYASRHVKVILGGQGGDEIFGGYARYIVAYLEQALKGAINETNEEGEHIVSLASIIPNLPALQNYIPMMKSFWKSDAFEDMDRRYFNLINRMGDAKGMLNPDFLARMDSEHIFSKFSYHFNHPNTKSYFNKMTHFDMVSSLPGLLQVEDRVSMSVSLESRVPLLDRRIVDLVSQMPAAMKFKGCEMKYLLKRTVEDILPRQIIDRKDKMGFPVPLQVWTKNKARDFILDILCSRKAKERGIMDASKVEKLMAAEQPFGRGLWGMLSLELWFGTFIDNKIHYERSNAYSS